MDTHSKDQLNKVIHHFDLEEYLYSFDRLNSGFINDTYLVSENDIPKYILQRINHGVFTNIEGLMGNIGSALKLLKASDYTQIKLIKSKLGKTYFSDAKGFWRMMTYIQGSTTFDTTTSSEIAFEAGRIIGKFHMLIGKTDQKKYTDTIHKFHNLELRKMQFLAALARASEVRLASVNDTITFAKKTFEILEKIESKELPIRICHNDTKLNNILFSKETQKALCLIDLDPIMKGNFHYDFGDAIRTIVNTAPEDEQDHSKITFEKNLFEAFVDGLSSNGSFLIQKEIDALPYGVILMPFLHGIRALTDYLNGNIYYKITYENQNLDRCLSLFDFTKKALSNMRYMKSTLSLKFSPTLD
jgi:Ser/Thr protein kinase RdoA (MazF antagonist)